MQIGQVPTMFYPAQPVVDVSANTVPDANLQTMFPDQFEPEPIAVAPDCFFCDTTRNWLMAGAAVVIFWAMRPRRR